MRVPLFNSVVMRRKSGYFATTSKRSIIAKREIEIKRRLECKVANFMWEILVIL